MGSLLQLKDAFVEKFRQLTEWDAYIATIQQHRRRAIRVNTLKISVPDLKKRLEEQGWLLTSIPWCPEGFYITGERRDIGLLEEHQRGYFFAQRSTSMIPSILLQPKPTDAVLDLCAAPGGKTTHLATLMQNKGIIVANEPFPHRAQELMINLQRCGVLNTVVTQQFGEAITNKTFDKILLDAPCSNSGSLRGNTKKSQTIMRLWNQKRVKRFAEIQKRLITHAYALLRPKGTLVYSTCSLDPEEDEAVVDYLLEKTDARLDTIDLPLAVKDKKYYKIWPQENDTDGFFVAKLRKP
ncbi:MAG: RsmB/NOP family class I SAM-dependent RNA methyltransferase [Nanoarchaeota archaeon]